MNKELKAFEDPDHEGNSSKYHTGKKCIEPGCSNPAGTWWSPFWCFQCNVKRIKKIDENLKIAINSLKEKKTPNE